MKKSLLSLIVVLIYSTFVDAQWESLSEPKGGHILDMARHNGELYISIANVIYKSNDEGLTWVNSRGNLPEFSDINSIGATEKALYAGVNDSGTGEKLYVSYDGGVNWQTTGGTAPTLLGVDWESIEDTAFVMTNFGRVFRTVDDGATFQEIAKAAIGHSIDVWGNDLFYLGQGMVRISTDRGDSVSAGIGSSTQISFRFGTMRSAIRIDTVFLAAAQGVFKLDADSVWQKASSGMPVVNGQPQPLISKLAYVGNWLWAFSNEGIYVSADTANTWSRLDNSPPTGYVQRVKIDGTVFHLATQNGYFISNGATDSTITFEQRIDGLNHVSIGGLHSINSELLVFGHPNGVLKSEDNGESFSQFGGDLSQEYFTDITLSNDTYFAIIGHTLHKSNDGMSWASVEGSPAMFAIEALNDTLFASSGSQVYKSRNQGANWDVVAPNFQLGTTGPSNFAFHDSVMLGGFRAVNTFGTIARSFDGGDTWEITPGPGNFTVSSEVVFIGDTAYAPVITTFNGGGVAISTDFGDSWEIIDNQLKNEIGGAYEIEVDGNTLYTITISGMWMSNDGARTWEKISADGLPISTFYSGSPLKVHNGFIYYAPYNNGIYKTQSEGTTTSILEDQSIANSFKLHQNYPNPFNPSTNINFSLPEAGFVSLKVYNILGQLVETLVDQRMVGGAHSISFDASRSSSGVYIYRLQAGNKVHTKKMLLIK